MPVRRARPSRRRGPGRAARAGEPRRRPAVAGRGPTPAGPTRRAEPVAGVAAARTRAAAAPVAEPRPAARASRRPAAPGGEPRRRRVAETIRVESDRLDHLMNLAGELVITKARFVAIARGLEELFRGSNAQALASDTRGAAGEPDPRAWTASRALKAGVDATGLARPLGRARPPAARQLPARSRTSSSRSARARAGQGALRGDPQPGPGLRRPAEGRARHADGADRPAVRAVPPGHPRPEPLLGQGGEPPDRRREDRAGQADDRRALATP